MKKNYSFTVDIEKVEELDAIIAERGLMNRSKLINKWLTEGIQELKGECHE